MMKYLGCMNNHFIANLLLSVPVKEFLKIGQFDG